MGEIKLDAWPAILKNIQSKIAESSFSTWFEYTSLEDLTEDELVIGVPNKFVKTFISDKFSDILQSSIEETLGSTKNIKYKIIHELRNKIENARVKGINLKNDKINSQNFSKENNTLKKSSCADTRFVPNSTYYNNLEENNLCKYAGLPLVQSYKLENFVVGPSNLIAYSGIISILEKSGTYNPIFVYGKSGLGKTHILHALCHEMIKRNENKKILFISCEEFVNDFVHHIRNGQMNEFREKYRKIDTLIVDDIHFLGSGDKKSTQQEFFHTFDALFLTSCQIIVSSDAHPKDIDTFQEKIKNRFISGLVAAIEPPNFETRLKILQQKCKERNYNFSKEVLELIAGNVTTNCRELEGALIKIHAQAAFSEKSICLELAQQILDINKTASNYKPTISTKEVFEKISDFFDISIEDLKEHKRGKNAVPRQLTMLVMRQQYSFSYQAIQTSFKCKSHASVIHGEKTILTTIAKDPAIKALYNKLLDHLNHKF